MNILRERRKVKGLTLEEASREIGIHFASLSRIERGQQTPSPKVARRLCAVYGLSMDDLYRDQAA